MIAIGIKQKRGEVIDFRSSLVELLKIWLVIKPLQYFYKADSECRLSAMRTMPVGTIGKDISRLLTEHNLKPIPKFEDHDLKHIVLDYGMSSIDEIKMQAYLIGNGKYSIFCILFLASGILFPEHWSSFYREYRKGTMAPSILNLSIDECMTLETEIVKATYRNSFSHATGLQFKRRKCSPLSNLRRMR
jgi:hypothetical protein